MTEFTFWWGPEGKPVVTIVASTYWKARAEFKQKYLKYAKYMGEVYTTKPGHPEHRKV